MFLTPAHSFIELRLADVVDGDTRFGQVARFFKLEHEQHDDGTCTVLVKVKLLLYSLLNNELAQPLPSSRLVEVSVPLVGNNDTLVDAETGEILAIRYVTPKTSDNGDWGELCHAGFGTRPVMLQGDWFEQLREKPIAIGALIRAHIQQASDMQKFANV